MSLHKSLKSKTDFGKNNVLNRIERLKKLKERGLWKEGDEVTGLPKEKIVRLKKIKLEKEEVEEKTVNWEDMRK